MLVLLDVEPSAGVALDNSWYLTEVPGWSYVGTLLVGRVSGDTVVITVSVSWLLEYSLSCV